MNDRYSLSQPNCYACWRQLTLSLALLASATTLVFANSLALVEGGANAPAQVAMGNLFINEINYDNSGSGDTDELVEIAGPAGTDLTGYSLVLYNGNGNSIYHTEALSGTIPDEGMGFGAIAFVEFSSIQNGSPDGIALCGPMGLVEFLSYEGTMTPTTGCAANVLSTDIGVSQTNSTAPGQSLQRTGMGSTASDFTWTGPVTASPGLLNAGQMLVVPNQAPTSSCADPIVVDDPAQPSPNVPSVNFGPIPANGIITIGLGFPGGVSAPIDLNCLSDDNDMVGGLEIRLAASTVLQSMPYLLENVYDIRDSDGAIALGLIRIQLTSTVTSPPVVTAPANTQISCAADATDLSLTGMASAVDGGGAPLSTMFADLVTPGTCAGESTIVRTFTATDGSGTTAVATQTITTVDNTAPFLIDTTTIAANYTLTSGTSTADLQAFVVANLGVGTPRAPASPLLVGIPIVGISTFTFPTTSFFVEDCSDEQTEVTITPQNLVFSNVTPSTITAIFRYFFADDCGNTASVRVALSFNQPNPPVAGPPVVTAPADTQIDCAADPSDLSVTGMATAVDDSGAPVSTSFSDVVTPGACAGAFTIVRTFTATDGTNSSVMATSSQTITVVDNTAPTVSCSEVSMTFDRCADFIFPNSPDGTWRPLPSNGVVANAAGGSSIQSVDFGSCVSDDCGSIEYRIASSFEENRQPGCAVDIINRFEFRDDCGNVSPDQVNVRFEIRETTPPTVTCSTVMESFTGCPDVMPDLVTGASIPVSSAGVASITVAGIYTGSIDLSSCVTTTCGDVEDLQLTLLSSGFDGGTPGCSAILFNEYSVANACGLVASSTILYRATISDGTPPTIVAPPAITIDCTDDELDLNITGFAMATDDCAPVVINRIASGNVFINEIVYDNSGSGDTDELVEIAGPAGTDLSGYSLELYNGNGNAVYHTEALSGVIADQANGFGALAFIEFASIQNGGPDGIALCGPMGLVEFLSYEGVMTPTTGCAANVTSTDIGVSQNNGTAPGLSLQRTGMGSSAGSFSWVGPVMASPNALNTGQTLMGGGGPHTPMPPGSGGPIATTFTDVSSPGTCAGEETIIRTFTATDACGNTAVASQMIVVEDNNPPTYVNTAGSLDGTLTIAQIMAAGPPASDLLTGMCANNIDVVALATLIATDFNAGRPSIQGIAFTAMDACGTVSYSASSQLTVDDACASTIVTEIVATDACGNAAAPFVITTLITSDAPASLAPTAPVALNTSAGVCNDPLGQVVIDIPLPLGGTIVIAGQAVALPTVADATGCANASGTLTPLATSVVTTNDPCVTRLLVDFDFLGGCSNAAGTPYQLTVDLTDDVAPVVLPPAAVTIDCNDDPTNLGLTGTASATDDCAPLLPNLVANGNVFINEIHYDNIGGDMGEGIEIVGPAGTDLSGYSLQPYNGSTGAPYSFMANGPIPLSGVISDQSNGFGAINFSFPANGLQNGAPDGIALCGPGGLIEFLSYEGSFTAIGGCADGRMSTDIQVEETNATPLGQSLQRVGAGSIGSDFTFSAPVAATPNMINIGQTFLNTGGPMVPGGPVATSYTDVVIPGSCPGNSTIQRTFTATDACGNTGTALQIINVTDMSPPTVMGLPTAPIQLMSTDLATLGLGDCAATADLTGLQLGISFALAGGATNFAGLVPLPTAMDDCSGVASLLVDDVALGSITQNACAVDIVVTFGATDNCGNVTQASLTLSVSDNISPVVDPAFVTALTLECTADRSVQATGGVPVFTDNCGSSAPVTPTVWINEIHYDNSGTDVNEGVEIAGPSGFDLTGYSLALYNGTNAMVYRTVPLMGSLNGTGTLSFPIVGLQNGPRDGIALVDDQGGLIEFLSYEGALVGADGPAVGVFSSEIGVREDGSTLETESLQRVGAGNQGSDFTWVGPTEASFGSLNAAQVILGQTVTVTNADVFVVDPSCPSAGTLTRTFTADDGCGNTASATLTITIVDTEAPTFTGVPQDEDFDCTEPVPASGGVTIDDCNPDATLTEEDTEEIVGFNGLVSRITRTYTADDGCGNVATANAVFSFFDNEGPIFSSCPANIGPLVADPDDRVQVFFPTPQATDNCEVSVTQNITSGSRLPVGTTTILFTATDGGGNTDVCSFTVTVVKGLNINCPSRLEIAVDDNGQTTPAAINFPYVATTCEDCPQGEPLPQLDYLGYFRGHRYYVSQPSDRRSWFAANQYAISLGGRLVEIDSDEENLFLQRELPFDEAYIGLLAPSGPGSWAWGSINSTYRNWAPGAPENLVLKNKAVIRSSDGLHLDVFDAQRAYIIEFDCVDFEVMGVAPDSLFDIRGGVLRYIATDQCNNRDTCEVLVDVTTRESVRYCTPSTGVAVDGTGAQVEDAYFVSGVQIGSFSRTYGPDDLPFHLRDEITVAAGTTINVELRGETSGPEGATWPSYWRVWLDADGDGDFYDDGELLGQAFGDAGAMGPVTIPAVVPAISRNARLRIAVGRYDWPEPCGFDAFGDYEDFPVRVTGTASPLVLRGSVATGKPVLTTNTTEDAGVASYLMLRGSDSFSLSKTYSWLADFQDGGQHSYTYADPQAVLSAYYQVAALDSRGHILRRSNTVHLSVPTRRLPNGTHVRFDDLVDLEVFPNPARETVTLLLPGQTNRIEFLDATGRLVVEQAVPAGEQMLQLDLPRVATGTYLVRALRENAEPTTQRIVIDQEGLYRP